MSFQLAHLFSPRNILFAASAQEKQLGLENNMAYCNKATHYQTQSRVISKQLFYVNLSQIKLGLYEKKKNTMMPCFIWTQHKNYTFTSQVYWENTIL